MAGRSPVVTVRARAMATAMATARGAARARGMGRVRVMLVCCCCCSVPPLLLCCSPAAHILPLPVLLICICSCSGRMGKWQESGRAVVQQGCGCGWYGCASNSDTRFLWRGHFCVGANMHANQKSVTCWQVAAMLLTCCQHTQLQLAHTTSPRLVLILAGTGFYIFICFGYISTVS